MPTYSQYVGSDWRNIIYCAVKIITIDLFTMDTHAAQRPLTTDDLFIIDCTLVTTDLNSNKREMLSLFQ